MKRILLATLCALFFTGASSCFSESSARAFSKPFIDAAKSCEKSVVSIKSMIKKPSKHLNRGEEESDFSSPENLWDFFFNPQQQEMSAAPKYAYGSGFIVSKDGYILTNNHVVEQADEITITLHGGKEYPAKKIGGDHSTDIAVLKIEATDLQEIPFADSSTVDAGEWVLAIGNPFGLEASVTAGIISAKCRTDLDIALVEKFFQTDAAINMGNSGGPLVNLDGEVVGMNTAIASNTGGYMGVGFAIQSNLLQEVMKELIQSGRLNKGYIGVALQKVTSDIAAAVGLSEPKGALISEVIPDGPADKAGIQSGDIIVQLNGIPVETIGSLRNSIALIKPGEQVTFLIRRNGSDLTIKATISEHPENTTSSNSILENYGLELETITPELEKKYSLHAKGGLLVTEVDPASKAYQSGLRAGMVILAINGKTITSVNDFVQFISQIEKGERVLLQVKIGSSLRFIPMTM